MKLFISYSHTDEAFATQLARDLEAENFVIWFDRNSMALGRDWSDQVHEALKSSETMILIVSTKSMESSHVSDEWKFFRDKKKHIIPLLLEAPEDIDMHFQLNNLQHINFYNVPYDKALTNLLVELRAGTSVMADSQIEPLPSHTEPSSAAYGEALEKIEIARAQKTDELDLSKMGLVSLPPEIGDLAHLRKLYLSNNHLLALPDTIGRLHNVSEIWLDGNQLRNLPSTVARLGELRALFLSKNDFHEFPSVVLQLPHLQVIRLSSNRIKSLPVEICQMLELVVFYLADNRLDSLPKELGLLPYLVKFKVVDNNPLSQLPDGVLAEGDRAVLHWLREQAKTITC